MAIFRARPTQLARSLRNNPTEAEKRLWRHLRASQLAGHKFSRQMPVGAYVTDFMCREAKLVVELDGGQHSAEADARRRAAIEGAGFRVIRFWNNEVFENLEGVLQTIAMALASRPPPTPSRKREGKSREAAKGWGP